MSRSGIKYTRHALTMLNERGIERASVETALEEPDIEEVDPDQPGLVRAYKKFPEYGGRILRVVYGRENDSIRVITAFFDRRRK